MSEFKRIHVDPEKLIQAVKVRPMIYNKDDPNYYHSKRKKAHCWSEICKEIVPNWDKLTPQARVECCHEIQRRWKSLRTCFGREVTEQKKEDARRQKNLPLKRRKVYGYYKHMIFLLPHFNMGARQRPPTEVFTDEEASEESNDPLDEPIKTEVNERESRSEDVFMEDTFQIYDAEPAESSTKIPVEFSFSNTKNDEDDDVKQFLMSLIPTIKKFDDRQKFEAKIEILKVLKNISFTSEGSSSSR